MQKRFFKNLLANVQEIWYNLYKIYLDTIRNDSRWKIRENTRSSQVIWTEHF